MIILTVFSKLKKFNCTCAKNAFFQQPCQVTNIKSLEYREKSEYRSDQNACLGCAWPARLFRKCLASTSSHEIDSRLYHYHLTFHVFGIDKMSMIFGGTKYSGSYLGLTILRDVCHIPQDKWSNIQGLAQWTLSWSLMDRIATDLEYHEIIKST